MMNVCAGSLFDLIAPVNKQLKPVGVQRAVLTGLFL